MPDIKYTKMQQAAIDLRDKNILVSAAAGSGKTAVLVKRIIDRVLDDNAPVDIDRILVMTFTRAAARQMKEKIIQAIDDKRNETPDNMNIQRQYVLVHNASITTIDSFCLNIVRNHFEEIDLSPDFRMADEGEIKLMMQDVLERLLEKKYEDGDEEFLKMVETFSAGRSDVKIEGIILNLYNYSQSYPYPDDWLDECGAEYADFSGKDLDNVPWVRTYFDRISQRLTDVKSRLNTILNECFEKNGPIQYEDAISSDIELADTLLKAHNYLSLFKIVTELSDYKFKPLKAFSIPKNSGLTDTQIQEITKKKENVKAVRDSCKKEIQGIIEKISLMSPDEVILGMNIMAEPVNELISVTKEFSRLLAEEKKAKNVVDFSDLEHFCLNILKEGKDTTAKEYAQLYKEIYVDEYQDSNLCQEEILKYLTLDEKSGNLFMVGDNKQSIYGFRLARPQIFIDKYERFADISEISSKKDIKIDLSDNFRSRIEVLNAVNSIFKIIMTKDTGGIEYNDKAALNLGASYNDFGVDNTTELILVLKDEDVGAIEAEAHMTAQKIKELMSSFLVNDNGNPRHIRYSDIVILMRSPKGRDVIFMNILENEGIPVHITASQGYFSAPEIVLLLNYLKIIDNPLQDIPLASVMLSGIGGFTEEDLAIIRAAFKTGYLFNSCLDYAGAYSGENPALSEKIKDFISEINYYREKSEYSSVEEILTEIVDKDYGSCIKALPGGVKRMANLNMLINKAKEYGKTSFKGIFHFNRYIEALKKYDIDYGEANVLDENDNTVRIMSIHKSKGLEFPVCFLSGMSNRLNFKDAESSIIIDNDYGFATDVFDVNKRLKAKSLFRLSMSEKKRLELLAEELRLLYVAMTRAKEKLIMTGTIGSEDEFVKDIKGTADARSYLDLVKYAVKKAGDAVENVSIAGKGDEDLLRTEDLIGAEDADGLHKSATCFMNISISSVADLVTNKTISGAEGFKRREELLDIVDECYAHRVNNKDLFNDKISVNDSIYITDENNVNNIDTVDDNDESQVCRNYIDEIRKRMSFVYPYAEDSLSVKMSVSELKHKSDNVDVKDELLCEEDKTPYNTSNAGFGALHGSAVHRIFELWDYDREATHESVMSFLEYVRLEKLMEDDLYETLNVDEIVSFVQSDIAVRMKKAYEAGTLRREQPFVISLDENNPDSMLVQGIIDAYFIEDNEIVLIDYKTDKNKTEQQLVNDHKTQLDYYALALTRMLGLKVKEKVIYSTELKKAVSI